jgi:hypothetical protein
LHLAIGGTTFDVKLALSLLAAASLTACHAQQSPDDTFRAFTVAVLSHQTDAAWALISKDSQEAMTQATAAAVAQAPKGSIPTDPKSFLFGEDVQLARPVRDIKVVDQNAKTAHLEVTSDDGKHPVTMTNENGGWKLDLTDGLKL